MALTVATGFVVDDAIVVLENITRHMERGKTRAAGGARRRARDRLHGGVDEPVADRGVHAHPVHGRHRRAVVPRVRRGPVGGHPGVDGGVADHHAHDVRALLSCTAPAPRQRGRHARAVALGRRAAGRGRLRGYRRILAWACATSRWCCWRWRAWSGSTCISTRRSPRASSRSRTPAASSASSRPTRPPRSRPCSSGCERFLAIVQRRPGGRERDRLHRRRAAQRRRRCS